MSDEYAEFVRCLDHQMATFVMGGLTGVGDIGQVNRMPVVRESEVREAVRQVTEKDKREEKPVKQTPVSEGHYRSPHKLPVCTDPDYASYNLYMHSQGLCPLHGRAVPGDHWQDWYEARENYASAKTEDGRRYAMGQMLSHVTETNPPVDAGKIPRPRSAPVISRRSVFAPFVAAWVIILIGIVIEVTVSPADGSLVCLGSVAFTLLGASRGIRRIRSRRSSR